jgi:hypothetical protein
MKHYFQTHPFSKIGILVIPILLFNLLMGQCFPKAAPEKFSSFIVAFEFARTPEDIHTLFGDLTVKAIHKIDIGNYLDFGFMVTYTTLLILSFLKFSKELNKKWLKSGIVLAVIVFLGDFTENIFLLRLTDNFLTSSPENTIISNLAGLHVFTWIKWAGLSICFTLLYSLFYKNKWFAKVTGVIFLLPLLFLFAMPDRSPQWLTIFTNLIFLCFTILIVYLFVYRKTPDKKS